VEIVPVVEQSDAIEIDEKEIRVDVYDRDSSEASTTSNTSALSFSVRSTASTVDALSWTYLPIESISCIQFNWYINFII
jgi:hypothetical protein